MALTKRSIQNLLRFIEHCEYDDVRIDGDPVIAFTTWNFAFGEILTGFVLQHCNNEIRNIVVKIQPELLEKLGCERLTTTIRHCHNEVFEFTECEPNEKVLNEI